jgi:hypothetical protein
MSALNEKESKIKHDQETKAHFAGSPAESDQIHCEAATL